MTSRLQDGIYLDDITVRKSCSLLFLRFEENTNANQVLESIKQIWHMCKSLEIGLISDLDGQNKRHLHSGRLRTLIGYGANVFAIRDVKKNKPGAFSNHGNFNNPRIGGGGPILENSGLSYSSDIIYNHLNFDHLLLRFVADNEFFTSRAVVETWKLISKLNNINQRNLIIISQVYTGFTREDKRNWLGFHDGVSNVRTAEREKLISIKKQGLKIEEAWTANGTYISFIRIELNLRDWSKMSVYEQQLVIGRDKLTGCPILRIEGGNKVVKDARCPINGTFEVIEAGNEEFRDVNRFYKSTRKNSPLSNSHTYKANLQKYRIFRQSFDFLEPLNDPNEFRIGINFMSFQDNPENLVRVIVNGFDSSFKQEGTVKQLSDFAAVRAAGIFYVPPNDAHNIFPGANIFINGLSKIQYPNSKYKYL